MPGFLPETVDKVRDSTNMLGISATAFANAISKAFAQAAAGGKQFDDVLKSLGVAAFQLGGDAGVQAGRQGHGWRPEQALRRVCSAAAGLVGEQRGAIKPFAAGGVIGTPTYFPLSSRRPWACRRSRARSDHAADARGRRPAGVAMSGAGQPPNVTIHIATPDAQSFRRSEAYITGQIARAVARGQRSF